MCSCSLLSFLQTAILDFLLVQCRPPCLWVGYRKIIVIIWGVVFPWFFLFLEVLHCYLHTCSTSHLLQSLLTDSGGKTPSLIPARDSESFSHLLCIHLFHPSCFLLRQFLRLYAFSWSYEAPGQVLTASLFILPRTKPKLKFVVFPWPADFSWISVPAH